MLMVIIFVGWMLIMWSNPVMRFAAAALVIITVWITVASWRAQYWPSRPSRFSKGAARWESKMIFSW